MSTRRCGQDEDDIELKDAQRIQLSRTLLMKWITEPFFADTVQGCLIRGKAVTGPWVASVADVEVREPGPCKYAAPACCLRVLPACGSGCCLLLGHQPAGATGHGASQGGARCAARHDALLPAGCMPVLLRPVMGVDKARVISKVQSRHAPCWPHGHIRGMLADSSLELW